jgi:hypothetical protein
MKDDYNFFNNPASIAIASSILAFAVLKGSTSTGKNILAQTSSAKTSLETGTKMPDKTIFIGISPETGKQLFTTSEYTDYTTFKDAKRNLLKVNKSKINGKNDWRLPTVSELEMIYKNKEKGSLAQIFNTNSEYLAEGHPDYAGDNSVDFHDGSSKNSRPQDKAYDIRLVR